MSPWHRTRSGATNLDSEPGLIFQYNPVTSKWTIHVTDPDIIGPRIPGEPFCNRAGQPLEFDIATDAHDYLASILDLRAG